MKCAIQAAVLASLIASSVAMAGTPPLRAVQRAKAAHQNAEDRSDSSQGNRNGDWKRSGAPTAPREDNDRGGGQRAADRHENRGAGDGRPADADRERHDRGERREQNDPRPPGRDDVIEDRDHGNPQGSRRDATPVPVIAPRGDHRDRDERRGFNDPRPNLNSDPARQDGDRIPGNDPGSRRAVPPNPVVDPRGGGRDRGERRGFNDPRPNVNSDPARQDGNRNQPVDRHWSNDRDSRHGDWPHDRNWNRDRDDRGHDRDWDRNHWRDGRGRDWHHEHGWYHRYRYDHFRYFDGWFFARHRFFIGNYYSPYGYAPHRWHRGEWLPFAYYDSQYALDNYWSYDLYDPPYGCRWIRVGSDALLVDIDTGEILDTIYDLYW